MLTNQYFYNQILRKVVVAFGAIFNGIKMKKFDSNTGVEISNVTVPVYFEGKETFVTRLLGDPTATRGVQIQFPVMSYEFMGISYDVARKISPFQKGQLQSQGNNTVQYQMATPYTAAFELNLYTRNWEDGAQILEQILPFFSPDYTLALKYLVNGSNYISEAVPIVLENVQYKTEYEGPAGTVRNVIWTLQFTAHILFYGPTPAAKVIKEVIINFRDYDSANIEAIIISQVNPITANVNDTWNVVTTILE